MNRMVSHGTDIGASLVPIMFRVPACPGLPVPWETTVTLPVSHTQSEDGTLNSHTMSQMASVVHLECHELSSLSNEPVGLSTEDTISTTAEAYHVCTLDR